MATQQLRTHPPLPSPQKISTSKHDATHNTDQTHTQVKQVQNVTRIYTENRRYSSKPPAQTLVNMQAAGFHVVDGTIPIKKPLECRHILVVPLLQVLRRRLGNLWHRQRLPNHHIDRAAVRQDTKAVIEPATTNKQGETKGQNLAEDRIHASPPPGARRTGNPVNVIFSKRIHGNKRGALLQCNSHKSPPALQAELVGSRARQETLLRTPNNQQNTLAGPRPQRAADAVLTGVPVATKTLQLAPKRNVEVELERLRVD
ncbi:hypothetical protein TCSYLVIO_006350, partial [Trypanosoma cruzi]